MIFSDLEEQWNRSLWALFQFQIIYQINSMRCCFQATFPTHFREDHVEENDAMWILASFFYLAWVERPLQPQKMCWPLLKLLN